MSKLPKLPLIELITKVYDKNYDRTSSLIDTIPYIDKKKEYFKDNAVRKMELRLVGIRCFTISGHHKLLFMFPKSYSNPRLSKLCQSASLNPFHGSEY